MSIDEGFYGVRKRRYVCVGGLRRLVLRNKYFPPNDMLMYLRFFLLLLGCGEASPDFRRTLGDSEAE